MTSELPRPLEYASGVYLTKDDIDIKEVSKVKSTIYQAITCLTQQHQQRRPQSCPSRRPLEKMTGDSLVSMRRCEQRTSVAGFSCKDQQYHHLPTEE